MDVHRLPGPRRADPCRADPRRPPPYWTISQVSNLLRRAGAKRVRVALLGDLLGRGRRALAVGAVGVARLTAGSLRVGRGQPFPERGRLPLAGAEGVVEPPGRLRDLASSSTTRSRRSRQPGHAGSSVPRCHQISRRSTALGSRRALNKYGSGPYRIILRLSPGPCHRAAAIMPCSSSTLRGRVSERFCPRDGWDSGAGSLRNKPQ